jgi:serine/threonine protein kinase
MQNEKGSSLGKRTLEGVDPDLLQLIGTLTADQQQSFLKVLSKANTRLPTKRSRQQHKQPAVLGSLNTTLRPSRQQHTLPAPDTEDAGEQAKDAGAVEPHLQRDTTGTFRIAYNYSSDIRQRTVDWIRTNCGMAYSRPIQEMWKSGKEQWTRDVPVPPSRTLANWIRVDRMRLAATVETRTLTKQQLMEGYTLACKVKQEKLGASLVRLTPAEIRRKALEVSMNSVLQHILDDSDSEQRAGVVNILLVSRDMHAAATKTAVFRIFIADMLGTADYQRILREFELSKRLDSPHEPEVFESNRKIPVSFSNLTQAKAAETTSVIGQDILDSLSNLGDGMPFMEAFNFIGKGTYGSVWEASDTLSTKSAWKILNKPVPLWAVPKAGCNEFTMNAISHIASRPGKATRQSVLPFAIGPIDTPGHPMLGKQCFGLPSKGKPGMFYPVLVKRLAHGTLQSELKAVSKLFNDRSGTVPKGALDQVASMLECVLEAVFHMHSYGGCHRDLKADNFLLEVCRPDSQGKFMRTLSKTKVKVYVGDLGLAIPIGVPTYCGKQQTFSDKPRQRAAKVLEQNAGVSLGQGTKAIQKAQAATEAKLREESALATPLNVPGGKKNAPVLMEVKYRALQLLTGALPSYAQSDDPAPPPQYANGWGTHLYSPPEKNPKLPPGKDYADSRSFRAGDMWAIGTMLTEMVKGNGLKVAFHPDDSHGKELFGSCYDGVFWRQHLNKLGDDVPEEWEPCVSLIRNLCTVRPEDRMTAFDALKHEFLHNIQSETRRR